MTSITKIPITPEGARQVHTAESSINTIPTNLELHPPPPIPQCRTHLHVVPSLPFRFSELQMSCLILFFRLPQLQAETILLIQYRYELQEAKDFRNHAHLNGSELNFEPGFSYICSDQNKLLYSCRIEILNYKLIQLRLLNVV